MPAAIGAAGAVALSALWGYMGQMLPASLTAIWTGNPILNGIAKGAGAIGLGMIAGKVMGREKGRLVAIGGLTVIGAQVLQGLVQQAAPTVQFAGLGAYMPNSLGAYMPGSLSGFAGPSGYNPAPYLLPGMPMGAGMPLGGTSDFGPGYGDSMFP